MIPFRLGDVFIHDNVVGVIGVSPLNSDLLTVMWLTNNMIWPDMHSIIKNGIDGKTTILICNLHDAVKYPRLP